MLVPGRTAAYRRPPGSKVLGADGRIADNGGHGHQPTPFRRSFFADRYGYVMTRFILVRLIQLILVAVGVASLLFVLLRFSGDPAAVYAGPQATPAAPLSPTSMSRTP